MKTAGLLLMGAVPGVALAYIVLTGILLGRVRPVPIAFLPAPAAAGERLPAEAAA